MLCSWRRASGFGFYAYCQFPAGHAGRHLTRLD